MQQDFTYEWACLSCICSVPVPKLDHRDQAVLSTNQGISQSPKQGMLYTIQWNHFTHHFKAPISWACQVLL